MKLQRYVLVEFLKSLGLAVPVFLALMFPVMMIQARRMAEAIGADVFSLLPTVPYALPWLLCLSLPMAFLVSCLLTFGRLTSSGQICAMKAAGVRMGYVGFPVIAAALLICPLLLFLSDRGIEWGSSRARDRIVSLATEGLRRGLVGGRVFRASGGGKSCSVALLEGGGVHLVIFDGGRRAETVEAKSCRLELIEGGEVQLLKFSLHDGVRMKDFSRPLFFEEAVLELEVPRGKLKLGRDARTSGIRENLARVVEMRRELGSAPERSRRKLRRKIAKALSSVEERLALSLAPLAFALFGIPLGLWSGRGSKTAAFSIGILVIFVFYYPLWEAGKALGIGGSIPHELGAWLPNALLAGAGTAWLVRWAD